jgi:hypothetical protein
MSAYGPSRTFHLRLLVQSGHQATLATRLRASAEAKLLRVRSICDLAQKKSSELRIGTMFAALEMLSRRWQTSESRVQCLLSGVKPTSQLAALIRSAGAVLLDVCPDPELARKIASRLEQGSDRVSDLHLWRLGPGHLAAVISVVTHEPRAPDHYKGRLAGLTSLSHVTVEVVPCPGLHH